MGLLATLIAAVAMALVAYLGAFENLSAWIRQLEPGQLGGLFAVFVVLTVALGIYSWRARSQLQRQATQHEREVGELELELTKLRHTREALQRDAATYRGVIADLPVALFAVDPEGVFTLTEGTGLDPRAWTSWASNPQGLSGDPSSRRTTTLRRWWSAFASRSGVKRPARPWRLAGVHSRRVTRRCEKTASSRACSV